MLSEDSYTGDPKDPLSLNLYVYCAQNPIMYTDPSGHFWETALDSWSLSRSLTNYWNDPSLENYLYYLIDVISIMTPFVSGTWLINSVDDALDLGKKAQKTGFFKKIGNLFRKNTDNVVDDLVEGTSKTGTDLARQLGKEGENAAGIVNAKQRIPSLSGTAKYRIPDELLQDQKILREIKNVSSQSYTNQLKDFNAWAKQNGYQFILEVRPGAKLSGPLQEAIKAGEIILKNIGQ